MNEQSLRQFVFNGLLLYDSLEALEKQKILGMKRKAFPKQKHTQFSTIKRDKQ